MKKTITLLIAIIALVLSSCNISYPEADDTGYMDIVTFVSTTSNSATFEMQQRDDSPVITYVARDLSVDTEYCPSGTRLLLAYTPISGEPYKSGYIHVLGMQGVYNAEVKQSAIPHDWDADGIFMLEMWRSGNYINVSSVITSVDVPKRYDLLVDPATFDDEFPQLYVVFENAKTNETERAYFASFDIKSLLDKSTCRGVVVNLKDTYQGNNQITFEKKQ